MAKPLLRIVKKAKKLKLKHFPTNMQAFNFGMWEMITVGDLQRY